MSEGKHTQKKWSYKQNRGNNYYEHSVYVDDKVIAELSGEGCTKEEAKANARRICQCVNSFNLLLDACKAQHEAIDRLFALLISNDSGFFPSKSGQPWQAILQGNAARAEAEKQA